MTCRLLAALLVGGLCAPLASRAQIVNNWGSPGSIRAGVTTGSSVTTSREQGSSTSQTYGGSSLTVTGENIQPSGPLGPGTSYTVARPGEPFQFSTTEFSGGLIKLETSGRSVDSTTTTNSMSVFSEVGR